MVKLDPTLPLCFGVGWGRGAVALEGAVLDKWAGG